jgi:hypothetical protein
MLLSTAWAGYFIYLNFQVRNGGLAGHQPHLSAGQHQECFGGRQKYLIKGQCHEIFDFRFFHESVSLRPLRIPLVSFLEIFAAQD